jgi:hypothetical protein
MLRWPVLVLLLASIAPDAGAQAPGAHVLKFPGDTIVLPPGPLYCNRSYYIATACQASEPCWNPIVQIEVTFYPPAPFNPFQLYATDYVDGLPRFIMPSYNGVGMSGILEVKVTCPHGSTTTQYDVDCPGGI